MSVMWLHLKKSRQRRKLSQLLGHAVEVVPAAEADHFVKDKAAAAALLQASLHRITLYVVDHIRYL
ncbi:MAG: hypothetical protein ACLU6Y_03460 [Ruminococcus sp.]